MNEQEIYPQLEKIRLSCSEAAKKSYTLIRKENTSYADLVDLNSYIEYIKTLSAHLLEEFKEE